MKVRVAVTEVSAVKIKFVNVAVPATADFPLTSKPPRVGADDVTAIDAVEATRLP